MKKILCIVLMLIMVTSIGNVCLAAPEGQNVEISQYGQPETILDDEVPAGNTEIKDNGVPANDTEIKDDEIPGASVLPKTGGIPSEVFYIIGALLVVSALIIAKFSAKPKAKS